ncbi:MAG: exosortase/archaeosortase family protein [Myxococcota bacterium]
MIGSAGARRGLVGLGAVALAVAHRSGFDEAWPGAAPSALDRALYAPSMASPLLALGVAAWLVLRRRAAVARALRAGQGRMIGLGPLAFGIGLLLWSRQLGYDHLVLPALLATLVGTALAVGGGPLLRTLAWPLAALGLATPLPPALLHPIVFRLQLWTVSLTSSLLTLLGRAHEVRGDLILDGGAAFQVVEGCSGFKTIVSLMLAGVLYADLVLRRPGAKAALVLMAGPVAIGVNGLRVLALVLGRIPAESVTHTAYGLLAMVGGVVALALVELTASLLLTRVGPAVPSAPVATGPRSGTEPLRAAGGAPPPSAASGRGLCGSGLRGVVLLALILEAVLVETLPQGQWPLVAPAINIETLPETIADRSARSLHADAAFLGTVAFGHQIYRAYERDAPGVPAVRVFIGHEDVSRPDRSGWSPKTAIPRSGWRSITRVPDSVNAAFGGDDRAWQHWSIAYADRRVRVAQRRIGFAPWGQEIALRWLGLDRLGWLGRRRSPLVVRLEADERVGDGESTGMILRQFEEVVDRWSRGERESATSARGSAPIRLATAPCLMESRCNSTRNEYNSSPLD